MKVTLTISKDGRRLGSVDVSPTSVDLPQSIKSILLRILPYTFFPSLDPHAAFELLAGMPSTVDVPDYGQFQIDKKIRTDV